jgi:hypothetical protein
MSQLGNYSPEKQIVHLERLIKLLDNEGPLNHLFHPMVGLV